MERQLDPRPAIVAEALTPADVRAAVLVAATTTCRSPSRRPATARSSPADGGLLVKTARMTEVLIDPDRASRGSGRARAGAT